MEALLQPSKLRFGAVPFDRYTYNDFLPALDYAIVRAQAALVEWKKDGRTDFRSVLLKLDELREEVGRVSGVFFNLHSAECSEDLQKIAPEMSSKLSQFGNDVTLDPRVFERVRACWEARDAQPLTTEERTILEKTYKGFVRNGALLDAESKERLRVLDEELSKVGLEFSQNVLKATNEFELVVTDAARLAGIPEAVKEAAAELGEKKGKPGTWVFNLDYPMVIPVMTYAKDRELRHQMFMANASKAFGGKYDNQSNVLKIARLRFERAQLLGYATHAHYVLEERMASTPEKVATFLDELLGKARPMAEREMAQLRTLARDLDGITQLERWDTAYYAEILKHREIGLDEEALRPYFELDRVIAGVIEVCHRLYDLTFEEVHDLPKYHADVRVFEIRDSRRGHVGLFYMDFFPRETKRAGAWMTSYSDQGHHGGEVRRPHVGIVCNFTKPTKTRPSLLSLDEVLTLYHEVGHALHGLLSRLEYTAVSGTSVFWDFVELPSQMMENWVYEKECLDLFARHYETGEAIPADLVARLQRSANFMEGTATMRQISLGLLDMSYHAVDPRGIDFVPPHEERALATTALLPTVPGTNTSCAFSHIFAGGYSAGYYSYKWAEVLDADAFELFRDKGIFNREVADLFREHILEKGGSEHPMELYKRFRGQEPTVDALLRRAGLSP